MQSCGSHTVRRILVCDDVRLVSLTLLSAIALWHDGVNRIDRRVHLGHMVIAALCDLMGDLEVARELALDGLASALRENHRDCTVGQSHQCQLD